MKNRHYKFMFLVIIIIVLIIILAIMHFSDNTSNSFSSNASDSSERLFNISSDEVISIQVQSGARFEHIDFSEEQEIYDFIQRLNDLSYESSGRSDTSSISGWPYCIRINYQDDLENYLFDDSWIELNDIKYYTSDPFLDELIALF